MGGLMSGPPPKKASERRRRNKDDVQVEVIDVDQLLAGEVERPAPDPNWEPLTREFYDSFSRSGQVVWMEPTDWMTAYALMEVLDRHLKPQRVRVGEIRPAQNEGGEVVYTFEDRIVPVPGGVLNSILKGLASLMATEGDRRRLRIELERKKRLDAALEGEGVVDIVQYRADLFKQSREGSA